MGFLALLHRKSTADLARTGLWLPSPAEQLTGDEADMDDEAQATDYSGRMAYRVIHHGAGGSLLTVWTYAIYVGDEGYGIRLRYMCSRARWSVTGDVEDADETEFGWRYKADDAARAWASGLYHQAAACQAALPGVFGWDGIPFEPDGGDQ
jgi:hypothetical protein